jgi:hypothetical protein
MLDRIRLLCSLATFFAASTTQASTFIPQTQKQLILESQKICAVEVLEVKSSAIKKTIVTTAKVKSFQCWKGEKGTDLVRWPGGTVNGKKTYVPSTPNLKVGQKAVLYLWKASPRDFFSINSWARGVELIEWDAKADDYILLGHGSEKKSRKKVSLSDFGKKIEEVLEKQSR